MNYEIVQDMDPMSPRDNDCLGTILYVSSRYDLGDNRVATNELESVMKNENNIVLPVYAYIHGGVSLNTTGFSCPWDSGQSGCIYVSKERVREAFKVKRVTSKLVNKIKDILKSEIEEFNKYINGEVYGYILRDDNGVEIDSCFGLIGEDVAKEEAESALRYFTKEVA